LKSSRPLSSSDVVLPLRVGARTIGTVRRRLVRRGLTLAEALAARLPALPELGPEAAGYYLTSLPQDRLPALAAAWPGLRPFVRQCYRRSYADLSMGYDAWLAGLSAKSRSTLKRKLRRFAEASGGAIDVRLYSRPEEMDEYHRLARAVSALSYQERTLDYGLPDGPEARAALAEQAGRDAFRGWILFLKGRPVAYLHAPEEDGALLYEYLGYDPACADLSPGTVLQAEAMRMLFGAGRFGYFDFTEGDGRHKRLFETGGIDCADLLLLRPTAANLAAGHGMAALDAAVAAAKKAAQTLGLESLARRVRR
jgi:CelD/BcsL family acetyltransferase involved in cellulose biosynthesis